MSDRMTLAEALALSGRAISRVDRYGARGAYLVTDLEIEAMVLLLAALGCPPVTETTRPEEIAPHVTRFLGAFPANRGDEG